MNNNLQKLLRYPKLIKIFIDHPGQSYTPHKLSKITGISYSTVWRYVQDLRDFGLISINKLGKYNDCKLNKSSPILSKLRGVISLEIPSKVQAKKSLS